MANTFHQIQLHIIFAVKYREALLTKELRNELYRYIGGVIRNNNQIPIMVGGWRDHVHILIGCNTSINIQDLVKDIKISANHWLQPHFRGKFAWQDGYSVFSISRTHENAAIEYIRNQDAHHEKVSMIDELKHLLKVNCVSYDERFLPHEPK